MNMNWGKLLHKTATVRRALWETILRAVKAKVDERVAPKEPRP